jgi:plastocyanin
MEQAESRRAARLRIATGFAVVLAVLIAVAIVSIRGAKADSGTERAAASAASVTPTPIERAQVTAPTPTATAEPAEVSKPAEPVAKSRPKKVLRKSLAKAQPSEIQRLSVAIGERGYEPSMLSAKTGTPIELTVAQGDGCAAGFLIPKLGVELDNSTGAATKKLGVLKAGDYRFTCSMGMVEGVLRVR